VGGGCGIPMWGELEGGVYMGACDLGD
jgi:hypothetical protein